MFNLQVYYKKFIFEQRPLFPVSVEISQFIPKSFVSMSKIQTQMKELTKNDIFFLKKKIEKSIDFPKPAYLLEKFSKTHRQKKENQLNHKQSNKNNRNQENYTSLTKTDLWMQDKQEQVRRNYDPKRFLESSQFNKNWDSNRIVLKNRNQIFQNKTLERSLSKQRQSKQTNPKIKIPFGAIKCKFFEQKIESKQTQNSKSQTSLSKNKKIFFKQQKIQNLKCNEIFVNDSTNFDKLSQKLQNYSSISRQTSIIKRKLKEKLTQSTSLGKSVREVDGKDFKGVLVQNKTLSFQRIRNTKQFIRSSRLSVSRSNVEKINKREKINITQEKFVYQSPQRTKSKTRLSSKYVINRLYNSSFQENQPIKKYVDRDLSPTEKENLKNKYNQLDNRLNNILRSVKTDKLVPK